VAVEAETIDNRILVSKQQIATGDMQLGKLSPQVIASTVMSRGFIDVPPGSSAEVSPFYPGYVKFIEILPGQKVDKGSLLMTLENPDYIKIQQSYLEAKEQIDYLKADFERQETLAAEKISSMKSAKKAESDYKVMLSRYQGLNEQLRLMGISTARLESGQITSNLSVYAPINGYITEVNVSKSSFINASEVAVRIVNTEHIHLELQVFEHDIMQVKEHQPISFVMPESGEEVFKGEVHLVGRSVDAERRTVDVHGHISEEDEEKFIPGMFVNAEITVSQDTVMCLPKEALVDINDQMMVAVRKAVDNEGWELEIINVETGKTNDQWVEILSPDLSGKEIVIVGAFDVIR
jgi:cobalt-zinc-cadmium efflux system membrane fusion protein